MRRTKVLVNGKAGRDGEKNDPPLANGKIARGRPIKDFYRLKVAPLARPAPKFAFGLYV